jgi:hypothetical protein
VDDLNDDELALLGAPWAKEGLLERKIYLEEGKRAKKNDWKQFFTVAQSGELHTFVFGSGSGFSGGSVGGGNWLVSTIMERESGGSGLIDRPMRNPPAPLTSCIVLRIISRAEPTIDNTASH